MLELQWSKRLDGGWYFLAEVAPGQLTGHGVFVVWRNGGATEVSAVLYVGHGSLRDEFARCLRDPLFHSQGLYVTWASLNETGELEPVAAYLYQRLRPMWGEAVYAPARAVNLPLHP